MILVLCYGKQVIDDKRKLTGELMETLRLMVKSILVIVMLAAFLEIVLPRSDMKRYVNLVIGLFVILSVLNPVLTLVNKGLDLEVFDEISPTSAETESLIRKGKEMANTDKNRAAKQFREKLSKQIMGLAGLYQGDRATGVEVELVEDPEAKNFGQIKKVIIYMDKKKTGTCLEPDKTSSTGIEVNVNEINVQKGKPFEEKVKQADKNGGLKTVIADFYGLDPEQIQIEK